MPRSRSLSDLIGTNRAFAPVIQGQTPNAPGLVGGSTSSSIGEEVKKEVGERIAEGVGNLIDSVFGSDEEPEAGTTATKKQPKSSGSAPSSGPKGA